ncbi:aminoglycoside phosphotransferase family protein [Actinomadura hibisca]|uniref:aminoglycoside phosphotransferase family protein n=1 Tax=Actinomadura hibisca TaxID=68565 RepID=UPI00082CCD94|nr:aminoglycoside phosphotransferase family protein [Actinomadura hibisca]
MRDTALPDDLPHGLPADLRPWVARHLPGVTTATDVSWNRANSRVWRLDGDTTAYLKLSPSPRSYARETTAYRHAAVLGPGQAARMLAADPVLQAVLTTALPGRIVRDLPLDPAVETRVHEFAGRLLRRWHSHLETAAPHARQALRKELADQAAEAADCLDELGDRLDGAQRALVRDVATQLPGLAAELPLVYRHGDYLPRNWLWDADAQTLAVIDFEMADHGLAVQDMVWLHGAVWPTRPDLRAAFLTGYDREPAAQEHRVLLLLTARLAVSYLATGLARNDTVLIDRGHHALSALARTGV